MSACLILYMMEQVRPPDIGHDLVFCCFDDSLFVVYLCVHCVLVFLMKSAEERLLVASCLFVSLFICRMWTLVERVLVTPWEAARASGSRADSESSRASCCFTATSSCSSTSISFHGSGLLSDALAADFHGVPWQNRFPSHPIAADYHFIPSWQWTSISYSSLF